MARCLSCEKFLASLRGDIKGIGEAAVALNRVLWTLGVLSKVSYPYYNSSFLRMHFPSCYTVNFLNTKNTFLFKEVLNELF